MIYVTHDQTEAMTMGDRITVMKLGGIMQVDTPMELYRNPANKFVAGFIGSPPMNFIEGEITADGDTLTFHEQNGGVSFEVKEKGIPAGSVSFGVRPEHFSISTEGTAGVDIAVDVIFTEPMGAETMVHTKTKSGTDIVVRIEGEADVEEGKVHYLIPTSGKSYYFGADEQRIHTD